MIRRFIIQHWCRSNLSAIILIINSDHYGCSSRFLLHFLSVGWQKIKGLRYSSGSILDKVWRVEWSIREWNICDKRLFHRIGTKLFTIAFDASRCMNNKWPSGDNTWNTHRIGTKPLLLFTALFVFWIKVTFCIISCPRSWSYKTSIAELHVFRGLRSVSVLLLLSISNKSFLTCNPLALHITILTAYAIHLGSIEGQSAGGRK